MGWLFLHVTCSLTSLAADITIHIITRPNENTNVKLPLTVTTAVTYSQGKVARWAVNISPLTCSQLFVAEQ